MRLAYIAAAIGVAALGSFALSGCVSTETAAEEGTWLTLQTIDTAQTANFAATHGRIHEAESAWIIGGEPARRDVYAYMGTVAALHIGAAVYMDKHHWPRWFSRLFEALTIADAANCVRGNYQLGIAAHF